MFPTHQTSSNTPVNTPEITVPTHQTSQFQNCDVPINQVSQFQHTRHQSSNTPDITVPTHQTSQFQHTRHHSSNTPDIFQHTRHVLDITVLEHTDITVPTHCHSWNCDIKVPTQQTSQFQNTIHHSLEHTRHHSVTVGTVMSGV